MVVTRSGELAHELVSDLLDNPGGDVVQRLVLPMPIRMIARILGIPAGDQEFFRHWSNEAIRVANIELTGSGLRQMLPTLNGVRHLHSYFCSRIESGELLGTDTLLGRLIAEQRDGDITDDELFFFALLLLLAGHETTTNLLSTMFLTMAQHPHQFAAIPQRPGEPPGQRGRGAAPLQLAYPMLLPDGGGRLSGRRCGDSGRCAGGVALGATGIHASSMRRTTTSPGGILRTSHSGPGSTCAWARVWPEWRRGRCCAS